MTQNKIHKQEHLKITYFLKMETQIVHRNKKTAKSITSMYFHQLEVTHF